MTLKERDKPSGLEVFQVSFWSYVDKYLKFCLDKSYSYIELDYRSIFTNIKYIFVSFSWARFLRSIILCIFAVNLELTYFSEKIFWNFLTTRVFFLELIFGLTKWSSYEISFTRLSVCLEFFSGTARKNFLIFCMKLGPKMRWKIDSWNLLYFLHELTAT